MCIISQESGLHLVRASDPCTTEYQVPRVYQKTLAYVELQNTVSTILMRHPPGLCHVAAGDRLALRVVLPKTSEELVLDYSFQPQQWHHVVIAHSAGSALVHPLVRLFVDGAPEASGRLRYPKVLHPQGIETAITGMCQGQIHVPAAAFRR